MLKTKKKKSLKKYITNIISFANSHLRNSCRDRSDEWFSGPVTKDLVDLMRCVWLPVVGFEFEIRVFHLARPKTATKLGFSLCGTTLVDTLATGSTVVDDSGSTIGSVGGDARENDTKPAQHFVESVEHECLFNRRDENALRPGDQLLQANGQRLWGISYKRVLQCLRNLPDHIQLVTARPLNNPLGLNYGFKDVQLDIDEDPLQVAASEVGSICGGDSSLPAPPKMNLMGAGVGVRTADWVNKAAQTLTNNAGTDGTEPEFVEPAQNDAYGTLRSSVSNFDAYSTISSIKSFSNYQLPSALTNLEDMSFTCQPSWFEMPLVVQLHKDSSGFGFSLQEFEPVPVSDPNESFEMYGKSTLMARRKSTGIASPLRSWRSQTASPARPPLEEAYGFNPDTPSYSLPRASSVPPSPRRYGSLKARKRQPVLLISQIHPDKAAYRDGRLAVGDRLLFVNDRKLVKATLTEATNALRAAPKGLTAIGVAKMITPVMDAMYRHGMTKWRYADDGENVTSPADDSHDDEKFGTKYEHDWPLDFSEPTPISELAELHLRYADFKPLDESEEQEVELSLEGLPLGLKLDAFAAQGVDGARVTHVLEGGVVRKHSALQLDDYITSINSVPLRQTTNVKLLQILLAQVARNCPIKFKYFPAASVTSHRSKQFNEYLTAKLFRVPYGWTNAKTVILQKSGNESTWGLRYTKSPHEISVRVNEKKEVDEMFHEFVATFPEGITSPPFVEAVVDGSAAERCGKLKVGDMIVSINGRPTTSCGWREANIAIREAMTLTKHSDTEGKPVEEQQISIVIRSPVFEPAPDTSLHQDLINVELHHDHQENGFQNGPGSDTDTYDHGEPFPVSDCEQRDVLCFLDKGSLSIQPPKLPETEPETDFSQHSPVIKRVPLVQNGPTSSVPGSRKSSLTGGYNIMELRKKFTRSVLPEVPNLDLPADTKCEDDIQVIGVPVLPDPKEEDLGFYLTKHKNPQVKSCFIFRLRAGSCAALSDLQTGDEILQVNEHVLLNMEFSETCQLIRSQYQELCRNCSTEGTPILMLFVIRRNRFNVHWMDVNPETSGVSESIAPISDDQIISNAIIDRQLDEAGNREILTVEVERSDKGYGLLIVNFGPANEEGVFVKGITKNTPAYRLNVFQVSDRILAVNGQEDLTYDTALAMVRDSEHKVQLKISRQLRESSPQKPAKTAEIVPNVPCDIELVKEEGMTFGFSIVGGQETGLHQVIIFKISPGGIADSDGRLRVGDQILKINDIDLSQFSHTEATEAIRTAKDLVKLTILRKETTPAQQVVSKMEDDNFEIIEVTLNRKPTNGLGIVLLPRVDKPPGVVIGEILNRSVACRTGQLLAGDVIFEVNDQDIRTTQPDDVITKLKSISGEVKLKIGRPKQGPHGSVTMNAQTCQVKFSNVPLLSQKYSDLFANTCGKEFGLSLREATDTEYLLTPCNLIVQSITANSSAASSDMIQPGDRLYAIEREPVDWLSCEELEAFLVLCDSLYFQFGRLTINHKAAMNEALRVAKQNKTDPNLVPSSEQAPTTSSPDSVFGLMAVNSPFIRDTQAEQTIQEEANDSDAENAVLELESRFLSSDHVVRNVKIVPVDTLRKIGNTNSAPSLGIRFSVGYEPAVPTVVKVYPKGGAYFSGLLAKDRIISINGESLQTIFPPQVLENQLELELAFDRLWSRKRPKFDPMILRVISNAELIAREFPSLNLNTVAEKTAKNKENDDDKKDKKSFSVPKYGSFEGTRGSKGDADGGHGADIDFSETFPSSKLGAFGANLAKNQRPIGDDFFSSQKPNQQDRRQNGPRRSSHVRQDLQTVLAHTDIDLDFGQAKNFNMGDRPMEQILQDALSEGVAYVRSSDMNRLNREEAKYVASMGGRRASHLLGNHSATGNTNLFGAVSAGISASNDWDRDRDNDRGRDDDHDQSRSFGESLHGTHRVDFSNDAAAEENNY